VNIPGGHGFHAGGVEVYDQKAWANPVEFGVQSGEGSYDGAFDPQRPGRGTNLGLEDEVVEDGHHVARRVVLGHVPRLARLSDATLSVRRNHATGNIINTSGDPQPLAIGTVSTPSGKSGRIGSRMTGSTGVLDGCVAASLFVEVVSPPQARCGVARAATKAIPIPQMINPRIKPNRSIIIMTALRLFLSTRRRHISEHRARAR